MTDIGPERPIVRTAARGTDGDMPDWTPHIRARLSSLRLSPAREAEIIDELTQHLDDRHRDVVAGGVPLDEATRLTLAEFAQTDGFAGRMATLRQSRCEEMPPAEAGPFSLTGFVLDLRHIVRGLRKDWGFTAVAAVTLALGIGANAAIFSAVHAIVLRPLPFEDGARLVNVWLSRSHRANWHFRLPPADVAVIQSANRVFSHMALYDSDAMNLTGSGDPEELSAGTVSAELFPLLGVRPSLGRPFDRGDEVPGHGAVALLSDGLWRRRFAADPTVLGTHVSLNDVRYLVVGVMPPGFGFPGKTDVWIPRDRSNGQANGYLLARMRPGISIPQAQADMDVMVTAIANGRSNPGMGLTVEPLKQSVTRNAGSSWFLLMAAVGCVLAIGCVNIANLILARGLGRQRDIDIRLALGATRGRIVRLLATESLLLAVLGGALALVVASWGIQALRAWAPSNTPRLDELRVEPVLLWVAMGISVATAVAFGLIPVLQFSRPDVNATLRGAGTAATTTPAQSRARSLLVIVEVALALVLLVGATLLVRSFARLTRVDPGFRTDHLMTMNLHLPAVKYSQPEQRLDFIARALAGVRSLPGVTAATASSGSVLKGWGLLGASRTALERIAVEGTVLDSSALEANMRRVEPAFFRTMGMRVLNGREFSDADRNGTLGVAIVNQAMARTYWGSGPALGRRLAFSRKDGTPAWLEIVGVVNDTRDVELAGTPRPAFFIPLLQDANGLDLDSLSLYVRTSGDPVTIADSARKQIWTVDPNQPIADVSTMNLAIEAFMAAPRFRTGLLAVLAALGLLLALVGIYSVMSYSVNQRSPEIAVRLALGAERRQIVGLVLRQGLALTAAGIALGIGASLAVTRLMTGLLYDVDAVDPPTLVGVAALVMLVALAACYLPASRASGINPTDALRSPESLPARRT